MLFIGVMSGTSCDGVDVVIVDINDKQPAKIKLLATLTSAYPVSIKQTTLKLIANQPLPISVISQLDAQLGHFYATVINDLMDSHGIEKSQVTAIGLHGQTVHHHPYTAKNHLTANTIQLGSAAITAQQTGVLTVANFRQMDVAHGGQGAPLAPVLHQQLFKQPGKVVAVLNFGGIANLTLLDGDDVLGFDTGPASCLMDEYIQAQQQLPFDESGQWAEQGAVNEVLLKRLLSHQYFSLTFPKSTGRELFNLEWLQQHLKVIDLVDPVDIQRTLLQFTVESVALGLEQTKVAVDTLVVCGGGVHNTLLMQQLQLRVNCEVLSSAELDLNPDFIEATLMAWLARENISQRFLNLASITGCQTPHVYGVQYQP